MHFDDRLATVLRLPSGQDGLARVQFRQLVDILGRAPHSDVSQDIVEEGFAKLAALGRQIPSSVRARLLSQPLQSMSNPRLLAWLAEAEPEVATIAIRSAVLEESTWLELIPSLPVRARGILRYRDDLPARVNALLDQLGVQDRVLTADPEPQPAEPLEPEVFETLPEAFVEETESLPPEAQTTFRPPTGNLAIDQDMSEDVMNLLGLSDSQTPPISLTHWAKTRSVRHEPPTPARFPFGKNTGEAGIGAIVRRIEEFRRARAAIDRQNNTTNARLARALSPVTANLKLATAIDFLTDHNGRISWADGPYAPSVIGLSIPNARADASCIHLAIKHRLPVHGQLLELHGAPAISGAWHVDAVPQFEQGHYTGYCGRLRRVPHSPSPFAAANSSRQEAERIREILHELRTPANAIQVASEIIQQQLYGPAPHEYRSLAASIAGDCAHVLAGFEELDRLVKLETGALRFEAGECNLSQILTTTSQRLNAWTTSRGSNVIFENIDPDHEVIVSAPRNEVERLIWRLFAALISACDPSETLHFAWDTPINSVKPQCAFRISLPKVLKQRKSGSLFDTISGERNQTLATGIFGTGFTLRLAAAEVMASGGALMVLEDTMHIQLPTPASH